MSTDTANEEWSSLNYEEKNHRLFLKQRALLDRFLETGAITKAQHDKSLHDLIEKMKDEMMCRDVEKYIEEHAFCSELIFRDWEEFLNILYANGRNVSAVLWWDYCRIEKQADSLGSGGYKDPKNPGYMYAETQFYEDGFETMTLPEILEYIQSMRAKYPDADLVPSFYLVNE
ncbi:MAG: hypothetical protein J5643_07940 [Lachnospiraceae bacterium]|nr:hypothetical protein [Lachnospiraceae bacterium]